MEPTGPRKARLDDRFREIRSGVACGLAVLHSASLHAGYRPRVARASEWPEVIALADLHARMPQDVVGGGDVEAEIQ